MNSINRRTALGVGAAGLAGLATLSGAKAAGGANSLPPLSAVITLNGVDYVYSEDQGTDLGDFVSDIGGFTQRCVRCDVAGSPITVFFRPDRYSNHMEVVFELGQLFNNPTPVNLGPYSVSISCGSQVLATISVPNHYWFSRWRWQISPRPVVGNVAALISQYLLPPYAQPTSTLYLPTATKYTPYTIMGLAGVYPYMPNVGERGDIGLLTEPQAQYVCTGDPVALQIVLAQAEAAGTVPWYMRDENTNAPISFAQYPKACWYQGQKQGTPFVPTIATPVTVDAAHQPALAYLPYLLTGDPYHLETLQFQATWNYGSLSLGYRPTLSQTRQFAWDMRTLGQCARITPATVPSWLLNKTYWTNMLTTHCNWFEANRVNSINLFQTLFRATDNITSRPADGKMPAGTWCEPWQAEFLACVFGWLVSMGHSQWRTSFDWLIGGVIARTNGTSGWPRALATPYEMMLRASNTSPPATSWAEAWSLNQTIGGLTYTNANTYAYADMTYLTYGRGSLVYADMLGSPLTDNLPWATNQINSRLWKTPYKWRLGAGLI
jgi:hypothetical protein